MKKKLFIGGIFTLISVISVVVYLVFQGIFIPNQISAEKYEIKGVDVASYQGDIDWRELEKQNMKFAFIKATEGSSFVDEYFSKNWRNANKTDMRIGAYHFLVSIVRVKHKQSNLYELFQNINKHCHP